MHLKSNKFQTPGRYATRADFFEVLEKDVGCLYLLAFLLTANHVDAERCFGAAVDDAFEESAVVKDWTRSWIKRCLIKNAIGIVSPEFARESENRDLWFGEKIAGPEGAINAVT